MKWSWKSEAPSLLVLLAICAHSAITWPLAPARLPVHWNAHGQIDRWGSKAEALLLMPMLAISSYLLMTFLPRIDPGRANYPRFAGPYRVVRLAILLVMAAGQVVMTAPAYGLHLDAARILPAGIGLLFVVLGATLGKVRPNWFFGIRTPWTLSSKLSWGSTNRLGGWLLLVSGVFICVVALVRPRWAFAAILVGALGPTVVAMAYSYFVWRRDPDRLSPAGTAPADE